MEEINDESSVDECKIVLLPPNDESAPSEQSSDSDKSRKHESCTAFCGLFSSVIRNLNCKRKKKRPDQVDLTCTPQNGLMVRMTAENVQDEEIVIEDASGGELCTLKVEENVDHRRTSRHSGIDEAGRSLFLPRVTSSASDEEAEERLLSRVAGRVPISTGRPRFFTLHSRRKRRPPTRGLLCNSALLDDLYNGPTKCVLSRANLWDFNAFALDSVCGGRPVAVLCVFLFHEYNLLNEFSLDTVGVWKCFSLIEEGYHASNPYHNAIHAADVTQAMHCYLQENAIAQYLTPFEKLAAIIASVCHDLDHPGVNQPFLIATDNHLAALYNNVSVLENHHWRCAMGCLWESGIINNWSSENVAILQEEIRSLILATDITRQNEFLTKFKKYQESKTLDMTLPECRHFSLQIALKCADICNPCRPWEVSRQWSHKICDEFYRQGDYERQLRLPVTSLCDRYVNSVAKIQTGFIKFVVSPLFESWNNWLQTKLSEKMQMYLRENLLHWETFLDEEKQHQEKEISAACGAVSSAASSIGSQTSILGPMEVVAQCLPLGRRYSLPLSVPSLLPRTVIRRESLSETGKPTLILDTVQMGELSVASVITTSPSDDEGEEVFGAEGAELYPEPTIAAMGEVGRSRKPRIGRRQSLPPLWDVSFVPARILRPLEAFTPLQEETPTDNEKETPITAKHRGCASSDGQQQSDSSSTSKGPPHHSVTLPDGGSTDIDCLDAQSDDVTNNKQNPSSPCEAPCESPLISDISAKNVSNEPQCGGVFNEPGRPRRSSLDNGKRDLKSENIVCKWPRLDNDSNKSHARTSESSCLLKQSQDKENVAPPPNNVVVPPNRSSEKDILKTRLWRSLNHDEGLCPDNRPKTALYKNLHQNVARGRRGSAPVLKLESLRSGLRGTSEINPDNLCRRRCSAPSNQIHLHLGQCSVHVKSKFCVCVGVKCAQARLDTNNPKRRVRVPLRFLNRGNSFSLIEPYLKISGSDAIRLHPDEKMCLLSKEKFTFDDDCNGNFNAILSCRRDSMPGSVRTDNFVSDLSNQKQLSDLCNQKQSSDLVNTSNRVSRTGCGGGEFAHSICEGNICLPEGRRGSSGFELLSGLWRYHLGGPNSNSLCSDDSVGMSSSGGATPGSPSTIGPIASFQVSPSLLPSPYYRRGSLPTDVYTSIDMRKWANEAS